MMFKQIPGKLSRSRGPFLESLGMFSGPKESVAGKPKRFLDLKPCYTPMKVAAKSSF